MRRAASRNASSAPPPGRLHLQPEPYRGDIGRLDMTPSASECATPDRVAINFAPRRSADRALDRLVCFRHSARMPMLEVEGVFTMLVPDGWTATLSDGTYELTRSGHDGAAHVSVYNRADTPVSADEAHDLIGRFLATISPDGEARVVVLPESEDQHRAVARCSDGTLDWLVFLVLWRKQFLMCSCTASPGSSILSDAEEMFATIHQPENAPKRRWRR